MNIENNKTTDTNTSITILPVSQKIFVSLIFIIRKYFQLLGGGGGQEEL